MKLNRTFYSLTIILQSMILTMECIIFLLLLLVNPVYFKSFIVNSQIDLNIFNEMFFGLLSLFQTQGARIVAGSFVVFFFLFTLIYFLLIRKIWQRPDVYATVFTGIVLTTTAFFCFTVLNFWQFFSNFM